MLTEAAPGRFPIPVRQEYQRLLLHLRALSAVFGFTLSSSSERNAALLVAAVECVDRFLDQLALPAERAALAARVEAAFESDPPLIDPDADEIACRLAELRELANRSAIPPRFRALTVEVLRNAESMRTTPRVKSLVNHAVREGQMLVELLLLVLTEPVPHGMTAFLRAVAGPANLWDKFLDAPRDHHCGELACRPVRICQAGLLAAFSWQAVPLAAWVLYRPGLAFWGLQGLWSHCVDTWKPSGNFIVSGCPEDVEAKAPNVSRIG